MLSPHLLSASLDNTISILPIFSSPLRLHTLSKYIKESKGQISLFSFLSKEFENLDLYKREEDVLSPYPLLSPWPEDLHNNQGSISQATIASSSSPETKEKKKPVPIRSSKPSEEEDQK